GAPCISFGAPGITLNLSGFTVTGLGDSSTGCQGNNIGTEQGIIANNQADETIQGPGLVQKFRADGILLANSTRIRIVNVTASMTFLSGMRIASLSASAIESHISVRNGNTLAPCGGL